MTLMTRRRAIVAGALAAPMLAHRGWARGVYPNKQIRIVVPFAAAGTTDLLRFALPRDSAALVKQMVAENAQWKKVIEAAKLEPQ